ncbi:MAG: glycine cleavage system aminomethyltransferase GcvT [Nocardioidaceae bacterium]
MSSGSVPIKSPLHERHVALGAKFAEFGGWEMPLEYPAGTLKEHAAVRAGVGIFDVSHLGKITVGGPGAVAFLNTVLTGDLNRIGAGQAQYTLLCDDETGGVVDDLIAYRHTDERVFLIPNAANCAEVAGRLRAAAPEGIEITDLHTEYAVVAIQGSLSDEVLAEAGLPTGHPYMSFEAAELGDAELVVCRTGYTGERGYELVVPTAAALQVWDTVMAAGEQYGIAPCGLASRDTLRTEMGYPLHGQDISPEINPVEAGLNWAVGWNKPEFSGKQVLTQVKADGPKRRLRGIVATGRAIPRPGMTVGITRDVLVGTVTSGTYSPSLSKGVGLALIASQISEDAEVTVNVRGRPEVFAITKPPFVQTHVRES